MKESLPAVDPGGERFPLRRFAAVLAASAGLALAFFLPAGAAFGAEFSADRAVRDLRSADAQARRLAAQALGAHHAVSAVQDLLEALRRETEPLNRETLVAALGAVRDKRAVPRLLELASGDAQLGVRTGAVAALHQIGDAGAWDALEKLAADPAQPAAVRRGCLLVTGARKGAEAFRTLEAAAGDKDPEVRETAVDALGRIDHPEARQAVEKASADGDSRVRKTAREILGRLRKAADKNAAAGKGRP